MAVLVTLDGVAHHPDEPLLCADDLAAVRGDGVFETLLVRDGRACLVEAHLQRLAQSARMLDLPAPDLPAWRRAIDAAAAVWSAGSPEEAALRLVYTRGREAGSAPTAYVTVQPLADRVAGVRRGSELATDSVLLPVSAATGSPQWRSTAACPAAVPMRCRGCWPAPRRCPMR